MSTTALPGWRSCTNPLAEQVPTWKQLLTLNHRKFRSRLLPDSASMLVSSLS